jgi:MFS family permease
VVILSYRDGSDTTVSSKGWPLTKKEFTHRVRWGGEQLRRISWLGSLPAFESFQFGAFRWLWLGTFMSFLAIMMQQITRGWLILRLTADSPLALSLVIMSFALPLTFASLLGGALADRFSRKHIIMFTQSGNAFLTFLLATLDATGLIRFWHLLILGLMNGTLAGFNMPSRQSLISDLVPQKNLMNAISLGSAGTNLTRVLGPALAGVLIGFLGTAGVFYLISLEYILSVICVAMIRFEKKDSVSPRKGVTGEIREGFRYALGDSTLLGLVIMGFVPSLFGFSYLALLPAWGREVLDVGSEGLGLLMTVMGVGSLAGTMVLASLRGFRRRGLLLLGNSIVWGICLFIFSQTRAYPSALPFLFLVGFTSATFMSLHMTLMQSYSSVEMRGRVVSMALMSFGVMPLSAVPFGALAERMGTAGSLGLSGLLLCIFTLFFLFLYPKIRKVA